MTPAQIVTIWHTDPAPVYGSCSYCYVAGRYATRVVIPPGWGFVSTPDGARLTDGRNTPSAWGVLWTAGVSTANIYGFVIAGTDKPDLSAPGVDAAARLSWLEWHGDMALYDRASQTWNVATRYEPVRCGRAFRLSDAIGQAAGK